MSTHISFGSTSVVCNISQTITHSIKQPYDSSMHGMNKVSTWGHAKVVVSHASRSTVEVSSPPTQF
jgi:hypothetical protein